MVVDPRTTTRSGRRGPTHGGARPESAPNACNDCHRDRPPEWAARAVRRWYPGGQQEKPHWASALLAGRSFRPAAEAALLQVIRDAKAPASCAGRRSRSCPRTSARVATRAGKGGHRPGPAGAPGAAAALEALPQKERVRIGVHLLWDPVRRCGWRRSPRSPTCPTPSSRRRRGRRSTARSTTSSSPNGRTPSAPSRTSTSDRERQTGTARGGTARLRRGPPPRAVVPARARQPRRPAPSAGPRTTRARRPCARRSASTPAPPPSTTRWACCSCAGNGRARRWPSSPARPSSPRRSPTSRTRTPSACTRGRADEALPCCGWRRSATRRARPPRGARHHPPRARGPARGAAWARKLVEAAPGDPSARALAASLETAERARRSRLGPEEAVMAIDPAECRTWRSRRGRPGR